MTRFFIKIKWNETIDSKIDNWKEKMKIIEKNGIKKDGKIYYGFYVMDENWKNKCLSNDFIELFKILHYEDGRILNPLPGTLNPFIPEWIRVSRNQLLIIDSTYTIGSEKEWDCTIDTTMSCYSEISGRITISSNNINKIIIHANHSRYDPTDPDILLPTDDNGFGNSKYIFHTHPKPSLKRREQKIVYEIPSVNDLANFKKYYNNEQSKTCGSIVITPEGLYIIRPLIYFKKISISHENYNNVNEFLSDLESIAFDKYGKFNDETFYNKIIHDYEFIDEYNKKIKQYNLFIEYYPRKKRNEKYELQPFYLLNINEKL